MRASSRILLVAAAILFGGLASLAPVATNASAEAAPQAQATAAPRFVYATGAQGVGFYPQQAAPRTAARPAANNNRTVGPGVRNWTTGRRSPLHRPWLRP